MPASMAPGGVFRKKIHIRFADVDFARVLYFPNQFHLLHTVMEDFFAEVLDLPYAVVLKKDNVGFPTVHVEADFLDTQEFGDEVDVAMSVREVGRSRVVFHYEITRAGRPVGRCTQTTVAIDFTAWKAIELPAKYRAALERVRALSAGGHP